ncbi:MAG: sigma-70 family RNA polymerase sigma factor [Planctomycetes bacterium]|nr:sigma-70 family RNA polymerase sigma factor [Planctomycetota bacterium]
MTPHDLLAEELTASAAALRELARDLIGGSDADDLVQETMLRAWCSPPAERVGMAAWLATVLRNLASNRRRDARRRLRREHEAALRRVADAGPPERPEHEVLREVTEALWRLPEPYQSTLAMRYFSGLTPKQITARTEVSLATVKSRLQRGLSMLREAMDRRGGDWRAGLVVAAGIGVPTAIATNIASGILLMTSTTKILLGLTTAAAVALLWLSMHCEVAPPAQGRPVAAAVASPVAVGDLPGDTAEREAIAMPDAAVVDALLAHPFAFAVDCTVRDRDGLLVPGAQIAISPRDVAPNTWHQRVDDSGVVRVEWRGKVQSMPVWVGVAHEGRGQVLREMTVSAGQPVAVSLLVGEGGGGGMCSRAQRSASNDCRMCHVGAVPPHLFPLGPLAGGGGGGVHPFATFSADLCRVRLAGGGWSEMAFDSVGTLAWDEPAPAPAVVTGTVRNANGAPLAGVTVAWLRAPDVAGGRVRTAADGTYRLELRREGVVELAVGGGPDGRVVENVELAVGATVQRDVLLRPGPGVSGQVLVDAGTSLAGWRVEYVGDGAAWSDGAEVRTDGTFVLADLRTASGRVLLWNADGRLPIAVSDAAATGSVATFDLRGAAAPAGSLRLRVADARPPVAAPAAEHQELLNPVVPLEVFVWHEDSGRGAVMQRRDDAMVLEGLSPGFYRAVAVGAPFGSCDLGRHWVDGRGLVDLGDCRLPVPGSLRLREPDAEAPPRFVQFFLRRPDVDLRTDFQMIGDAEVELPAGAWLHLAGGLQGLSVTPFTVRSGGVLELALPR